MSVLSASIQDEFDDLDLDLSDPFLAADPMEIMAMPPIPQPTPSPQLQPNPDYRPEVVSQ